MTDIGKQGLRTANHSAFRLYYHIIFSVKCRRRAITGEMLDRLEAGFRDALAIWDCRLVEFGGEADHVHLLIDAKPAMDLSSMIANLKTVSSRRIRSEFAQHLRQFANSFGSRTSGTKPTP